MENLGFGVEIMIVGFLIVIVALLTLAFILVLFEKLLAPKKKKQAPAKAVVTPSGPSTAGADKGQKGQQDEVVAAIAASLTLFLEKPFRIRHIAPAAGGEQSRWLLAQRTRAVQGGKELVFYRRRKNR